MPNKNEESSGDHGQVREFHIVINAQQFTVTGPEITYEQIFALASDGTWNANTSLTITYHRGHGDKPEGTLVKGGAVKLKEDMVFDVDPTGKS